MNLDQLEAVLTILDKGSFRAAAEHLHRSQPALSASIKNLEEEFDIQIFDRSEYRPKLTEMGSVFINSARATFEASQQTIKVAKELGLKKAETKLKVSVDPLASLEFIEAIALECARPTVPVILILDRTVLHGSHNLLLEDKVDLALAPCPHDEKNIDKIIVEKVTMVGAISRKLLQEKRKADEAFLKNNPQIFVYNKDFEDQKNDIYEGGGRKIFVPDHSTKLSLITNGLGWGRISQHEFDQARGLVTLDKKMCPPLELELCLMKSKKRPLGPVARAIWNVFSKQYKIK